MNDFFGELAKQLASRWLSYLVLPGVLFLCACWVGAQLGQARALDAPRFAEVVRSTGETVARAPVSVQVLVLVGVALASTVAGIVVQGLVGGVRAFALGLWPWGTRWVAAALTARRRRRWRRLQTCRRELEDGEPEEIRSGDSQAEIDRLAGRANRIALALPTRPTWMGDRIGALETVAKNRAGLDLTFGWSRLWLVLPDSTRGEINAVQSRVATSLFAATWSVPYLVLGLMWWPSAIVGAAIAAVARGRARAAIAALSDLVEATIDVYGRLLAVALGVCDPTAVGPLTPDEGRLVSDLLRKGR